MNQPSVSSIQKPEKRGWQRFLETPGGAALITVLLGGILGQWINLSIQKSVKEREFQQGWLKARGDQALEGYKEYLGQEKELIQRAYKLIGSCLSTSEDLIILTRKEFAPGSHVGVEEQTTALREQYNKIDMQWRSEREEIGLLMSYYHQGQQTVIVAWQEVQEAITSFMDCARHWYLVHPQPIDDPEACRKEKESLREKLSKLSASLESARHYVWEGWETPDKLRNALKKK